MCEAGNEKIYEKKFLRDLEQLWPVIYCESMWHRRILEPPNSVESNVKWCEIVFRFPNETNETSPEKIFRPFSCFLCAREEILNVQLQQKKTFFLVFFIFYLSHHSRSFGRSYFISRTCLRKTFRRYENDMSAKKIEIWDKNGKNYAFSSCWHSTSRWRGWNDELLCVLHPKIVHESL